MRDRGRHWQVLVHRGRQTHLDCQGGDDGLGVHQVGLVQVVEAV